MNSSFMRILSALALAGLLTVPAAHGTPSTTSLNQEALALMRSGDYAASASVLALIGHIDLASSDPQLQSLGAHYLDLSQAVASLASVSGDHVVAYATVTVQPQFDLGACLAALAELAAAELAFDAACVSPAVVVVAPCVAAILILSAAAYNAGKECG